MNPHRPRRPTAWEVSFPDEPSEDDDDEKEEEGAQREELPVRNSKRKTYGNIDDRVRYIPSSL